MSDKFLIGANTRDTAQSYVDYLHNATHDGGRVGVVVPDRRVVAGNNVAVGDSGDDYNGYFKIVIKEEIEELPEGETLPEGEEPKKHYYLYIVDGETFDSDYKYADDENDPSMYNMYIIDGATHSMKPYKNEIIPPIDEPIALYVRCFIQRYSDGFVSTPDIVSTTQTDVPVNGSYFTYLYIGSVTWNVDTKMFVVSQREFTDIPTVSFMDSDKPLYRFDSYRILVSIIRDETHKSLKPITGPIKPDDSFKYYLNIVHYPTYVYNPNEDNVDISDAIPFRVNGTMYTVKPYVKQLYPPSHTGDNPPPIYFILKWKVDVDGGLFSAESEIIESDKSSLTFTDKDEQMLTVYECIGSLTWSTLTKSYVISQLEDTNRSYLSLSWYYPCLFEGF